MTQEEVIQILSGFVGTLGFGILFNIRGVRLAVTALGGLLSWLLFVLLKGVIPSEPLNYFLVALSMAVYAEIMARVLKTPTTTFITTSLVPLIPGGSLYYTMSSAFEGDLTRFLERALYTLQLAASLALGIMVATAATRILNEKLGSRKAVKQCANKQ